MAIKLKVGNSHLLSLYSLVLSVHISVCLVADAVQLMIIYRLD